MGRGPSKFREVDLKRALKVTLASGLEVERIEGYHDGRWIVVMTGTASKAHGETAEGANTWDEVLDENS